VARTSIREAIQGLHTLGLIERRGNRTYVVEQLPDFAIDGSDGRKRRVQELFEVRRVVEIPIAELAATRAGAGDVKDIKAMAARFNPRMSLAEFRPLDRQFHWTVARACGNDLLAELYGKVLESLFRSDEFESLLSATGNQRTVRHVIAQAFAAHRKISEAIATGDSRGAVTAAEEHLDEVEAEMVRHMA
jgi:GntR family transcriptional repressor for pyruvate dehydrogenase complex